MDETMTGVFKCRCCGAEIKEKDKRYKVCCVGNQRYER